MITNVMSIDEFKEIFIETLLNKTTKVTKVSETSVLNGVSYGVAKIGQKITKDIAIVESHLFPDSAYGQYLDNLAKLRGASQRRGSTNSSTYVRLFALPGTVYNSGIHTFTGNSGVIFNLDNDVTISNFGFGYAKVSSQTQGAQSNVDPLTITRVSPIPVGHEYCINEYSSVGGRDFEDDNLFRERIKTEVNLLARHTLAYLEQVFSKINNRVLRVFNYGFNQNNEVILGIATVDGTNLNSSELNELLVNGEQYFSIVEMRPYGSSNTGVVLQNIIWQPIDISFRVDLDSSFSVDEIRKRIQVALNKELDFRFWSPERKVEWDNLLQIVKGTDGVRYVADQFFFPNKDIPVDKNKLPRIRGFQMLDLDGNVITNLSGTLNPTYYPNNIDFLYQADVLASI